jgi:hypothetical protein
MRKIKKVYEKIVEHLAELDIEYIRTEKLHEIELSDNLDVLDILYFKSFNNTVDKTKLRAEIEAFSDEEEAIYRIAFIGDIVLVIASI